MNAEKYLPVPHVKGGYTMEGADCWGLVIMALDDLFGVTISEQKGCDATGKQLFDVIRLEQNSGRFLELDEPEAGAIVTMGFKYPHHVGLCLDGNRILHTMEGRGADITPLSILKRIFRDVRYWKHV